MNWRYDEDLGTDVATEITFTAQRRAVLHGRTYRPEEDVTITLPKPIDRGTLAGMAGQGGPWGWGGYTGAQLKALEAGEF